MKRFYYLILMPILIYLHIYTNRHVKHIHTICGVQVSVGMCGNFDAQSTLANKNNQNWFIICLIRDNFLLLIMCSIKMPLP